VSLFDPLRLGGLTLRNRVMMSPMSQRAAGEDGRATDWHLVHYGSRAVGGCGLVMVEDTAVAPLGRTSRAALGLYDEGQVERLRRIVSFCREQGAATGVQLAHAGRKALADKRGAPGTVAPSPLAYGPGWAAPREADGRDLAAIVAAFAGAAAQALEAGFDVLEVHAAHGYLLHQFLSPLTNRREDGYGGDGKGRRRLLLETLAAVRERWPAERPLFVRLPAGDGAPGGLEAQDIVECACACAAAGATLIDLTGGTPLFGGERVTPEQTWATAAALRGGCELPLALGGGIVGGADAQALLDEHGAALVSVGRPLLKDPYWPVRAARELDAPAPLPAGYAAALDGP
jgi:2,4-dienoyl-CoA reductase-like NADH-dependent reductase (Old Yellow Enzyme family)